MVETTMNVIAKITLDPSHFTIAVVTAMVLARLLYQRRRE